MIIRPQLFRKVNVDGTNNVLRSVEELGTVQGLVFTSTSSVVHDNTSDMLDADEELPVLRPPTQQRVYTLTKADAEAAVLSANRKSGNGSLLTCSLRPCTAIGEADTICLGKMIRRAEEGKMRFQMGQGRNVYDFVYVGNLADAHILAARKLIEAYGKPPPPAKERVDGQCFNVTNDERVLFWEFSRSVAAATGHPVSKEELKVVPVWVGLWMAWCSEWWAWLLRREQPGLTVEAVRFSTINRTLSVEKAKRVLGYRPSVSIEDGVRRGVTWYFEHKGKEKSG